MLKLIIELPKKIALLLIKFYQKFLSFDHSFWAQPEKMRVCIHYPSCSEYTAEAIERHGLAKGSVMGTARIIRCNPFSKGGFDPVPDHFSIKSNNEGH
jgi:hypothetical protein